MGKFSKKLKKAALAGAALYTASKMMGKKGAPTGAPASAKSPSSTKRLGKEDVRVVTGEDGKTMTGGPLKIKVDKDALPREIKAKADKVKSSNKKIKKIVIERRDTGKLSSTMPKTKSQADAMTKKNSGLGMFDGAKTGKMIRARGGGMATQGMKPTKLY